MAQVEGYHRLRRGRARALSPVLVRRRLLGEGAASESSSSMSEGGLPSHKASMLREFKDGERWRRRLRVLRPPVV